MSALMAGTLGLASCSLDEYNPGGFTMENIASNSVESYRNIVNQCYFGMERALYGCDGYMELTEAGTDLWVNAANINSSYTQYFWYYAGAAPNLTYTNTIWNCLYDGIGSCNLAISLADRAPFKTEEERNAAVAEARFMRAFYYFWLVNLYAQPYAPATAADAPGVPLKTTSYMEDLKFFRTRHDTLYNHIAEDLMQAGLLLQGQNEEEKFRASSDAAWALLSRVRLYMGDWEQVVAACDMVNALDRRLEPLTENYNADFIRVDNPEIIFMSGSFCMRNIFGYLGGWMYRVSDDFLSLFGENEGYEDLRETAWLTTNFVSTRYVPAKVRSGMSASGSLKIADAVVIRYAEVLLNKAEALVMLEREEEAVAVLEELLKNRYKDGKCPAITARGEELMDFIRTERRKELCFEGHRWFDLRRYAVNPKYPLTDYEIVHKVYDMPSNTGANQIGTARLKMFPEGKSWTLQIPAYEININPDIEINVRTDAEYVEL